jgi:putative hydrolase of the HAD superfamily
MGSANGRYHTVFFDVGGTLLSAKPSIGAVYAEVAARYGIEEPAEAIERRARAEFARRRAEELSGTQKEHTVTLDKARAWWRSVVRVSFGEAAGSPRFEAFFQEVFEEFARPERYGCYPEVVEVLKGLKESGYRLGIISNWDERLRPILAGLGILDCFETVVISGEVGFEKPGARIYDRAREMAGATREDRLLQIGDNRVDDFEGAHEAGFEARLVERRKGETLDGIMGDLLPE